MSDERDDLDDRLLAQGRYSELLAAYYPVVIARLRLRLPAGDVYDVAQNTMLRLFSELRRGKRYPVPFRAVVHQVLGWTVRGHWQDAKPRPECQFPPDWDIADERPAHSVEGDDWVRYMIAPLPERDRQVATWRYLDGMEIQQIADDLGINRNAVDQIVNCPWPGQAERDLARCCQRLGVAIG